MAPEPAQKPRLVDGWVVFIDIVGFRSLAECPGGDISKPLDAIRWLDSQNPQGRERLFFRISDSAVCVVPIQDQSPTELQYGFGSGRIWARQAQTSALNKGLLLRGGLTRGGIYCDESRSIVFGPALHRAYSLESTRAVVPRIVVDQSVIPPDWEREHKHDLIRFGDGLPFIDYLGGYLDQWSVPPYIEQLKLHRVAVLNLVNASSNTRNLAICNYLVTFHNALLSWVLRFIDKMEKTQAGAAAELRTQAEEQRIVGFEIVPALLLAVQSGGHWTGVKYPEIAAVLMRTWL